LAKKIALEGTGSDRPPPHKTLFTVAFRYGRG